MKSRRAIRCLSVAILLSGGLAAAGSRSLTIEVRGRARTPGEVLLVRATAEDSLLRLQGEFLGRKLFMTALPAESGSRRVWFGWTMIELEREPGDHELRLLGTNEEGEPLEAMTLVRIEPREFPREELSVSPRYVDPPPEVQDRRERERRQLAEVYRRRTAAPPPLRPFLRPVDGEPTSTFGTRRFFNGKPRDAHPGLDLRAKSGTPVRASGDGEVALAQDLYFAGNTIILDHGGGLFTLYAHLAEIQVEPGERIQAGRRIGLSGATGRVTGPHLHWGAKIGNLPFDPSGLLDSGLFGIAAGPASTVSKASAH